MREISGKLNSSASVKVGTIERATLGNCHVSASGDPERRVHLYDGRLSDCKHDGCWVNGALIENVQAENLKSGGRLKTWLRGCVFSGVVLRGKISGVTWQRAVSDDEEVNSRYDLDAKKRYTTIDTALDVTGAFFDSLTVFAGVPPELIRRDPSRYFLLRTEHCREVLSTSSTLLVVAKLAESEPTGVVFTFGGSTDRDRRRGEECHELKRKGLLQ
jgi:hypothetical protein